MSASTTKAYQVPITLLGVVRPTEIDFWVAILDLKKDLDILSRHKISHLYWGEFMIRTVLCSILPNFWLINFSLLFSPNVSWCQLRLVWQAYEKCNQQLCKTLKHCFNYELNTLYSIPGHCTYISVFLEKMFFFIFIIEILKWKKRKPVSTYSSLLVNTSN